MSKLMKRHGECSLVGQVLDASTRAPMAGVTVMLFDFGRGTYRTVLSDSHGGYRVGDLPCGTYHLDLSSGDRGLDLDVSVPRSETKAPTVQIPEHPRPRVPPRPPLIEPV